MGVRGLTRYIASKAEKYLDPHELHDCNLVIDGDNLASQLYRKADLGLSAFGGNYDYYFREVVEFFNLLKKCNVRAFVLMDGGYENKKMKTTRERLLGRIGVIKYIIPLDSKFTALPLMMRECFVDAVRYCNVKIMRCWFEADNEIAILGKKLNAPVLSYDSDFYIFDGLYIPYVTITHKLHKKTVKSAGSYEVEVMRKRPKGSKNWKKSTKKFLVEEKVEASDSSEVESVTTYNYLDCCIYTVQNLTEGQLDKEMLPLFAALIGNDFIEKRVFNKFYSNVRKKKFSKSMTPQQKRIFRILDFLRNETFKTAVKKILGHMKMHQRETLLNHMKSVMNGYNMEKSEAFDYFELQDEFPDISDANGKFDIDELLESSDEEEAETTPEDSQSGDEYYCGEEDEEEEAEAEESETNETKSEDEVNQDSKSEHEGVNEVEYKELKNEASNESESEIVEPENEEEISNNDSDTEDDGIEFSRKTSFPDWFKNFYSAAEVPRFVCDLFVYRRYINYPQVEEFDKSDCNQIAYPILKMIFSIFHSNNSYLTYITRIKNRLRYEYKRFEKEEMFEISDFDPHKKRNVKYLKDIFQKYVVNYENVFKRIYEIPECHQLFMLAVIFWLNRSHYSDSCYLMSVLLGMISLTVIDKKCEKIHRDPYVFNKNYKKYLDNLKTSLKEKPNEKCQKEVKNLENTVKEIEPKQSNENDVAKEVIAINETTTGKSEDAEKSEKVKKRRKKKKTKKSVESKIEPARNEGELPQVLDVEGKTENLENQNLDTEKNADENISKLLRSLPKEVTKQEALLAMETLISYFPISPKMERKHADFRRNVVHGFSELQAVIANLNALNPVLNFPFENIKIENYFNGLFLYNMYNSLKSRTDPKDYIKKCIFQNSPNLWKYFTILLEFCVELLPNLKQDTISEEPTKISKKSKKKPIKKVVKLKQNDCVAVNQDDKDSDTDFNDLNNKFNTLLNLS